ncbi:MAG: hypothetical protein CMJ96_06365 [Planctomycetes bacterium]|nr:hypothetical protein [Planctomycetota bacterium]MDP7245631.1 hypothetical protein [Planctomycetota bacterium]|tara:strand:- start:33575 stop:35032 length:1458 start_codon:yes stop_codon:yes gene_type:complete
MMGFLGGLLVVLTAYLAGRLLMPNRTHYARSRYEELTTSILLGLATLMTAGMAATWALGTFSFGIATLLSLGFAGGGVWRIRREWKQAVEPCAFPVWERPLMLSLAIGSVAMTLAWPLNEFDPILHFGLKGKLLFGGESIRGEAFHALTGEFGRIMTHPNYPLGIPIMEAWSAHFAGEWSDRWIQFPLAFWAFCLPGAVAFGLRRFGAQAARRGALVAACTPILYVMEFLHRGALDFAEAGLGAEKMLGGRGDLPVAAFVALACGLLLRGGRCRFLAGLAMTAAILSKNEGLALSAVLLLALALGALWNRGKGLKEFVLVGSAIAVLASPWLIHRTTLPAIDENYTEAVSYETVLHYWQEDESADKSPIPAKLYGEEWSEQSHWRPARIARYFGSEFIDVLSWGLLWLLFLLGIPQALRTPEIRWLLLFALGGLALYALILLVTPWFLIALHQKGIPARLILHLLGPIALLCSRVNQPKQDDPVH